MYDIVCYKRGVAYKRQRCALMIIMTNYDALNQFNYGSANHRTSTIPEILVEILHLDVVEI